MQHCHCSMHLGLVVKHQIQQRNDQFRWPPDCKAAKVPTDEWCSLPEPWLHVIFCILYIYIIYTYTHVLLLLVRCHLDVIWRWKWWKIFVQHEFFIAWIWVIYLFNDQKTNLAICFFRICLSCLTGEPRLGGPKFIQKKAILGASWFRLQSSSWKKNETFFEPWQKSHKHLWNLREMRSEVIPLWKSKGTGSGYPFNANPERGKSGRTQKAL